MANLVCMLVPGRHLATVSASFGEMSTDISQGLQSCLDSVLTLKESCTGILVSRHFSSISASLIEEVQQAGPLPPVAWL